MKKILLAALLVAAAFGADDLQKQNSRGEMRIELDEELAKQAERIRAATTAYFDARNRGEFNPREPDDAKGYVDRGSAYSNLGDARAIADFSQAIKIDPKYARAYYNRGNAYAELGDTNKAIADYTRAIELDPKYASVYVNRGIAYYNLGDADKAIADYTRAIELDPSGAKAYRNRGIAYRDLSDYKNATKDAREACELGDCELLTELSKKKLLRD